MQSAADEFVEANQDETAAEGVARNAAPLVASASSAEFDVAYARATAAPVDAEETTTSTPDEVAEITDGVAPVAPVAHDATTGVADVVSNVASGAPADVALFEIIAPPAAHAAHIAPNHSNAAPKATEDAAVRTFEDLLVFINQRPGLAENVHETARLKISTPTMTSAAIAGVTRGVDAGTALRHYQRAEAASFAAGFSVPPLLDPTYGGQDASGDVAENRELVVH